VNVAVGDRVINIVGGSLWKNGVMVEPPGSNSPPPGYEPPRAIPAPPAHNGPTIDSRDENFVKPLVREVLQPELPAEEDNPATYADALFKPLKNGHLYNNEHEIPGEFRKPWHKRKLTGRLARGPNRWGK